MTNSEILHTYKKDTKYSRLDYIRWEMRLRITTKEERDLQKALGIYPTVLCVHCMNNVWIDSGVWSYCSLYDVKYYYLCSDCINLRKVNPVLRGFYGYYV